MSQKQAFGYIRVSTDVQANKGVSLEAQEERIKAWCQFRQMTLAECFVDRGLSGKNTDNRPALKKAIETVCQHSGALIVYSLSRLTRSTKDAIVMSDQLGKAGADLVSVTEDIDTTTPSGKMVFRILAVLAEFERDVLIERTMAAMAHLRGQDRRISGKIPFGFDLLPDGQTLAPNPLEQLAIKSIRASRTAGDSLRAIAKQLNADGIKTKYGKPWGASSIQAILAMDLKRTASRRTK